MRGPVCIAEDPNTAGMGMRVFRAYLRRPWTHLCTVSTFKGWPCIVWGKTTGVEVNVGRWHFELQHRDA